MRHWLFAGYALVCLICLIWPVYAQVGVRIEPLILGLPFSFAWVIGWVVLTFIALLAYHMTGTRDLPDTGTDMGTDKGEG